MRTTMIALFAAVLCLLLAAPSAEAGRDHRVVELQGVIAHVGDSGFVLLTERGFARIGVVDRTRIALNGERAELEDLQRGDRARVRAGAFRWRDDVRFIAFAVNAHRRDRG